MKLKETKSMAQSYLRYVVVVVVNISVSARGWALWRLQLESAIILSYPRYEATVMGKSALQFIMSSGSARDLLQPIYRRMSDTIMLSFGNKEWMHRENYAIQWIY